MNRYGELEIRLTAAEAQRYQALSPEVDLGLIVSLLRELDSARWGSLSGSTSMPVDPMDLLWSLVTEQDDQPWGAIAEGFQVDLARTIFDPSAPPYRWESRPRGGSKTTDVAGIALVLMLACLPAGSRGYCFASDKDQAALLTDALAGFVHRTTALQGLVSLANYKVTFSNGSALEVLPADAASSWGIKPALVIADEVCQWPTTRNARSLWEAVYSSLGKVAGSRLIAMTTSGDPAHWSRKIYESALESPLWSVQDVAGPLPWTDRARLADQRESPPSKTNGRRRRQRYVLQRRYFAQDTGTVLRQPA